MHHLARRTSLVGRQPEALRRRGTEEEGKARGWRVVVLMVDGGGCVCVCV